MAGKLKNIKCGEFVPTVINDSGSGYVELQINDEIVLPFSKHNTERGKRDESNDYFLDATVSEAEVAWEADSVACATCAVTATCAICASVASTASHADYADYTTKCCYAEYWWEVMDSCQKGSFINTLISELTLKMCKVNVIVDEQYNTTEHALQIKKKHISCIWNDESRPGFTTITNGKATKHVNL